MPESQVEAINKWSGPTPLAEWAANAARLFRPLIICSDYEHQLGKILMYEGGERLFVRRRLSHSEVFALAELWGKDICKLRRNLQTHPFVFEVSSD
jgi:hypothetical protein